MKKVLLVGINFSPRKEEAAQALAPYYLKSYCDKYLLANNSDISIRQFLTTQENTEILKEIVSFKPDIVGFSVYVWNVDKIMNLCKMIKEQSRNTWIILGGAEASPLAEEIMNENPFVDIVVRGEGEETFYELLHSNLEEDNLGGLLGITYRKNGLVINNPSRPLIKNLDQIPSSFLNHTFDFSEEYNVVHIESLRGCIYSCRYCCWTSTGMREFTLARVFEELKVILKQQSVKGVCFCDSNLLFNKQRTKEIFKFLIGNNERKVPIFFELNAEFLDDEIIDLIRQLPTHVFSFGIQTINPEALKAMNRKFNQQRFEENVVKLRQKAKQSYISFDLIYGLPADTLDGFKKSLDYALSYKPENISIFPLLALPGSEFFNQPQKYGLILQPGAPHRVLYTDKFSPQEMLEVSKIGLFVRMVLRFKILRDYFYFLSIHVYKKKSQRPYLEPILGFLKYVESRMSIFDSGTQPFDLVASSDEDSSRLNSVITKLKKSKLKLIRYFINFSLRAAIQIL